MTNASKARNRPVCREAHLSFNVLVGDCLQVYDLSQKSPQFFRTELQDSSLCGLKTNTKLYSTDKQRIMSGVAMCSSMVLPCTDTFVPTL